MRRQLKKKIYVHFPKRDQILDLANVRKKRICSLFERSLNDCDRCLHEIGVVTQNPKKEGCLFGYLREKILICKASEKQVIYKNITKYGNE